MTTPPANRAPGARRPWRSARPKRSVSESPPLQRALSAALAQVKINPPRYPLSIEDTIARYWSVRRANLFLKIAMPFGSLPCLPLQPVARPALARRGQDH